MEGTANIPIEFYDELKQKANDFDSIQQKCDEKIKEIERIFECEKQEFFTHIIRFSMNLHQSQVSDDIIFSAAEKAGFTVIYNSNGYNTTIGRGTGKIYEIIK